MAGAPLGNKNAANGRRYRDAIRRQLAKRYGSVEEGYDAMASLLIQKAEEGDLTAIKEVGDREDGKPAQVIAGDEDAPLKHEHMGEILIRAVDATASYRPSQEGE